MARRKRATAAERARIARQLVLGLPAGISVDGAITLDKIAEYLCDLRVMTFVQIMRILPNDQKTKEPKKSTTVRYWLEHYPYIQMRKIQAHYYDGVRSEWIKAIKVGAYSLTKEGRAGFELTGRREKIAELPATSQSTESAIQAVELYTRLYSQLFESEKPEYGWMSNLELQEHWRQEGLLQSKETISTTGNILKYIGEHEAEIWSVSLQTKKGNMLAMVQRTFPASWTQERIIGALVFAKHETLAQPLSTICQRKSRANVDHVRFLPYEFTWHHPRWFKAVLDEEPWDVLGALLEYYRAQGFEVVDRKARYGAGYGRDNPFRYQVTMNSAEGEKRVEYVDTTYGVPIGAVRGFIESRKLQVAPKPTEYPERYVLYVASEGERKGLTEAAEYMNSTVQIRLIDWPEESSS